MLHKRAGGTGSADSFVWIQRIGGRTVMRVLLDLHVYVHDMVFPIRIVRLLSRMVWMSEKNTSIGRR